MAELKKKTPHVMVRIKHVANLGRWKAGDTRELPVFTAYPLCLKGICKLVDPADEKLFDEPKKAYEKATLERMEEAEKSTGKKATVKA